MKGLQAVIYILKLKGKHSRLCNLSISIFKKIIISAWVYFKLKYQRRWSYRRISKLILYSFYKNTVLYLTQFFFIFYNGFSGIYYIKEGTSLHDPWTLAFYNVLFTSLPVITLGVFDRDINADIVMKFPEVYQSGHKDVFFNFTIFLSYTLNSIFHSAVCFFIPYYSLYFQSYIYNIDIDMISIGILIITC
jgi:magnesium-transporting ATPase (P-type)